jgi:predicted lactoylglutathione lyase
VTTTHSRKLFVNLPVRDLSRSMEFFSMQFTNHETAS